ncbi:glycosyltransferase [Gracilibacillus alcaliphilus]|uniref:glycosyltransferase n=1 Tax=Gracilibacillus alcaliphilus TaxID=1401441 RepID=UPI00195AB4B1|nr:glycosyltransferase [Gracilibacillus alcaliphilus]MBM7678450.1 glycosyltransferase involved in cell wall biosynthesis [Gracilibacillus alcaliphilus]
MFILKIGRSYPQQETGMMGIFEYEQAEALGKYGHKIIYISIDTRSIKRLRKFGFFEKQSEHAKGYCYHLPIGGLPQNLFSKIKLFYYRKLMKRIIEKYGIPDIIHVHFPLLTLTTDVWEYLKSFDKPIVVTEHWTKVQIKDLEPFRVNLLKRITEQSNTLICVSDTLKRSIEEITKTNKNILVIPNMVSPEFYYDNNSNQNNREYLQFVTIGRLVKVKRFDFLVRAFIKAFKGNQNVRLVIVGGGPVYNDLLELVKKNKMEDQILLLGFQTRHQTAKIIRESDAFVSASELETFGVPFIEAMVSGKPVIGIKNGPIDRYISKENGILFEKNSINELEKALYELLINKNLYDGESISSKACSLFSEESVTMKLSKVYRDILKNK